MEELAKKPKSEALTWLMAKFAELLPKDDDDKYDHFTYGMCGNPANLRDSYKYFGKSVTPQRRFTMHKHERVDWFKQRKVVVMLLLNTQAMTKAMAETLEALLVRTGKFFTQMLK